MPFTPEEIERSRYLSRKMYRHDCATALGNAEDEGKLLGLESGQILGRMHVCQRLLGEPLTFYRDLDGMSVDELRAKADELEQRLSKQRQGVS